MRPFQINDSSSFFPFWPRLNPWNFLWRWICLFTTLTCHQNHSSPSLWTRLLTQRLIMCPAWAINCPCSTIRYFVSVWCLAYARQGILSKVGCPHPSAWPPHLNCLPEMFSKPAVLVGTHALFFRIRLSLPSLPCVHLISTTSLQSIPANSWVIWGRIESWYKKG